MNMFKAMVVSAAAFAFVPVAFAQTAEPAAPASASSAEGTYSDEDIQKYATALVAINKVQADTTLTDTDKQAKMAAAVQGSGLDIPKFNQISQAMQSDKALNQRIQTAAAAVPR